MKTKKSDQKTFDVAVIGAGIIGVSCALQLAERGLSVIVIDRHPPCEGASFGNAGVISPWSCVPQSVPGLWRKLPKWLFDPLGPVSIRKRYLLPFIPWAIRFFAAGKANKVDSIGDAMISLSYRSPSNYRALLMGEPEIELIKDSSYIFVYKQSEQANLDHFGWKMRQKRSVPLNVISAGELQEREPDISKVYQAAIMIHEQARALNPSAIGKAIAKKARALGVHFVLAETKALTALAQSWTVHCQDQQYTANKTVLATGVWSASLLRPFGINMPLEAERGYHLLCQDPGININNSIMDVEHMCVASQMVSGVRIAGTAEFAGIEAAPDNRRAFAFKKSLKTMFPSVNTGKVKPWMGQRPTFPDSLPCIGPIEGLNNLYAAFGHSHYGLSQAPKTGQIIADCITNKQVDVDLTPYKTTRFR